MKNWLLPFFIVLFPQFTLAIIQHGKLVLTPIFIVNAGLPQEIVGIIGGLGGLGSVWCFASNKNVVPVIGPLNSLILGCILAPLGIILFGFEKPVLYFIAAPIVGYGYALTAASGSQILASYTPKEIWGTLFSLRMAGVPLGGAVAGIICANIETNSDLKFVLLFLIIPAILTGFFLIANRKKFKHNFLKISVIKLFDLSQFKQPFIVLAKIPGLKIITIVSICYAAIQGSVFTFLTTFLIYELKFPIILASSFYAVMQISSMFGRIFLGIISDKIFNSRIVLFMLGILSFISMIFLSTLNFQPSNLYMYLIVSLIGISVASWNGLFMAEVSVISKNYDISESTSASTFFTFLSYMLSPPLFAGVIFLTNFKIAFLFFSLFGLLASFSILYIFVMEKNK